MSNIQLKYKEIIQLGGDIDGLSSGDNSGWSVAMSNDGTRVVVGSPLHDLPTNSSGSRSDVGQVRVFDYDPSGNTWVQVGGDLYGYRMSDEIGHRVEISKDGSRIAYSAMKADKHQGGNYYLTDSGVIRVFDYDPSGNIWTQVGGDIEGDLEYARLGDSFSMSSDGSVIAAGNPNREYVEVFGDPFLKKGLVQIFKLTEGSWTQIGQNIIGGTSTLSDGTKIGNKLGKSLSLSGNGTRVAIGALNKAGSGLYSGSIRVFDWNGIHWVQTAEIYGESSYYQLGYRVSISDDGNRIAASSPGVDSSRGQVQVFGLNGGTWKQLGDKILGEAQGDYSGVAIEISKDGNKVAIGADFNQGFNAAYSGHVRIYEWKENSWKICGSDIDGEAKDDQSGTSVALSADGSIIAVGAIFNDGNTFNNNDNRGHVRVYRKRDVEFTPPSGYNSGDIKPGMDLSGVNLSGVNLTGADLTGTNFTNANLTGVIFTNATLRSANFTNANLTGVNFTNAIVDLAEFRNATLTFIGDVPISPNTRYAPYNLPLGYVVVYNESGIIVFRRTTSPPTNITLSHTLIPENLPAPLIVGTISTEDPDSNTFTYSLSGGPDDGEFFISGDKLYINVTADFETKPHYTIQIRTTDESGNSRDQLFTIQIFDIYHTSINTTSFSEYTKVGEVIATLSSSDIVEPASYSFVSGYYGSDDNDNFTISNNQILLNTVPDRLTKSSYITRIKTTTGSGVNFDNVYTFTIQIEPKLSSISFDENISAGSEIATISINDSDNANFVYSIVSGFEDHNSFSVEGNKLKIMEIPNYEVKQNYNIKVKAVRGEQIYESQITLTVIDKLEHFGNEYDIQDQTLTESQKTYIQNIIRSHNSGGEIPQETGFQINSKIIGNTSLITDLYVFSDTHFIEAIPNIQNLKDIYLDKSIKEIPPNTLSQINNSVKMNVENVETVSQDELKKVTKVYSKNRTKVDDDVAEKIQILKNGTKENITSNFRDVFTRLKTKQSYISKPKAAKRVIFKQALKNAMKVAKKSAERVFKIDKAELFEVIDIPEKVKEKMEARGNEIAIVEKSQDENDIALVFDENNLGDFYCDLEVVGDKVLIKFFGTKVKLERTSETENTVSLLSTDEGSEPATLEGGNIVSATISPTLKFKQYDLPFFFGSVGGSAGEADDQQLGDICFPAGTPVKTDQGEIAIEKLTCENTIDGVNVVAVVPVYNKCDYLVKINKHALGPNYPKKTTLISRNHRVYLNKKKEDTIPALALYNGKTVTVVQREEYETIYNVLLPTHSKMTINGLVVETLHPKSVYAKK